MANFKRRLNVEVRRQKMLDITKEWDFRKGKLSETYTAKMLYK